jgi:hypothetical protein
VEEKVTMLTCIPPKSSGDIYVGASSGYKPAKVMYGDKPAKIAVTYNHDISTWDTDADIVLDRSLNQVYFLDKAGRVQKMLLKPSLYIGLSQQKAVIE